MVEELVEEYLRTCATIRLSSINKLDRFTTTTEKDDKVLDFDDVNVYLTYSRVSDSSMKTVTLGCSLVASKMQKFQSPLMPGRDRESFLTRDVLESLASLVFEMKRYEQV